LFLRKRLKYLKTLLTFYLGCPATYQVGIDGDGGISLPIPDPGARRRHVVVTTRPLYPRERNIFMASYIALLINDVKMR
jgi:hypothetical protein